MFNSIRTGSLNVYILRISQHHQYCRYAKLEIKKPIARQGLKWISQLLGRMKNHLYFGGIKIKSEAIVISKIYKIKYFLEAFKYYKV